MSRHRVNQKVKKKKEDPPLYQRLDLSLASQSLKHSDREWDDASLHQGASNLREHTGLLSKLLEEENC